MVDGGSGRGLSMDYIEFVGLAYSLGGGSDYDLYE